MKKLRDQKSGRINLEEYVLGKDENVSAMIRKLSPHTNYCLIFACGDGTINSAINALMEKEYCYNIKVTVLPMGTANVFAKELNIKTPNDTLEAIAENRLIWMPIIKITSSEKKSKFFFLMASVGLDSIVVNSLGDKFKKRFGKLAYILLTIKNFFRANKIKLTTRARGKKYENVLTCVCNGKYYAGKFKVAKNNLSKNSFDVIMIKKFKLLSLLKYYIAGKSKNISLITVSNPISIDGNGEKYPVEADGDYFCHTPVTIELADRRINAIKRMRRGLII
jgi:diacylglycerol kinase family enzyme